MKKVFTGLILLIISNSIFAQVDKKGVQNSINNRAKEYEKIALIDAGSNFAFKDPVLLFTWQSKMDKVIERLKIKAAELGANGILILNTDNKIYQSVRSDSEGRAQTSSNTEKFVKAIAIYVIE